jgi:hypothetical protein
VSAYWNAVQACVWIATRDEREVDRIQTTDTLFVTDDVISSRSLMDASHHLVMAATLDGETVRLTVWSARQLLAEACGFGTVVMLGRKRGEGDLEAIPVTTWGHLEIRDHDRYGVIAASPDMFDGAAQWWDELRLRPREVQRQWPFPRKPRRIGFEKIDDRPDTVGRDAWRLRRWRDVCHQPPTQFAVEPDGLPSEVEVSLVEALSWVALGRSVPHWAWVDSEAMSRADGDYASARDMMAHWKRRLRSLAATSSASERRAADGQLYFAAKDRDLHLANFAESAGHWRLLQEACGCARERRALENTTDAEVVQGALDEAERLLFKAFLGGDLDCLGRNGEEATFWEILPKDCFRFPVEVRLNHNILEPHRTRASVDEHKLIMGVVAKWRDLRVNAAALRAWWDKVATKPAQDPTEAVFVPTRLAGMKQTKVQEVKGWLSKRFPGGIPSTVKNMALVSELAEAGIRVDERTVRRALGKK